jgi:hypothetical protein
LESLEETLDILSDTAALSDIRQIDQHGALLDDMRRDLEARRAGGVE